MEKDKKKKDNNVLNKICRYFMYFMMYAIIGWLYEVFLEVVVYRWGFSNRGVLFGPYLPVYGFGALIFILCFYRLIDKKDKKTKIKRIPIVFLGCMFAATLLELITSYLCEFFMGSWPWQTYADYAINFQARIALSPSIRFGLGGLLFLYILQPLFEKLLNKLGDKKVKIISICLFIIIVIDMIFSVISRISNNDINKVVGDTKVYGYYLSGAEIEEEKEYGIIKDYDSFIKLLGDNRDYYVSDEDIDESIFNDKDFLYYILDVDSCGEEIKNIADVKINGDVVNVIFNYSSDCGVCAPRKAIYFIGVSKNSISNISKFNVDYNLVSKSTCDPNVAYKPILYLYPNEESNVSVKLNNPDNIISSYPKYNNGWNMRVLPNGDMYDSLGKYYYALYWDEIDNSKISFDTGFYVEADKAIDFLEEKLSIIGLTDKERNEFIMYWLPTLQNNGNNLIHFKLTDELQNDNKLIISPKPDSLLRVRMIVKKVNSKVEIKEQELPMLSRDGFVAVEWGGVIVK